MYVTPHLLYPSSRHTSLFPGSLPAQTSMQGQKWWRKSKAKCTCEAEQQREQHRAVIILWCCRYIVAFVQESITLSICTCLGIHRRLRPMPSLHGINLLSFISNWILCWKMAYPFSYTESYYTASAKSLMRIRMFCNKDRRYRHVIWPTKKRKANQWRLSYTLLNTGEWPKERNLERRERQSFIFCH